VSGVQPPFDADSDTKKNSGVVAHNVDNQVTPSPIVDTGWMRFRGPAGTANAADLAAAAAAAEAAERGSGGGRGGSGERSCWRAESQLCGIQ
jgi:hypothetical protein